MASPGESAWTRRPNWVQIGRVLLEQRAPMTAGEIAATLRKDDSNTRSAAGAMARAGLLEVRPCSRRQPGPGKPPAVEFLLRESAVPELERVLAERVPPGTVRAGQQFVFADASALGEMAEALAEAGVGARGSWTAVCDGAPQECMMVFDGPGAVRAAVDLMSMLRAAEVRCRRVGVAELLTAAELAGWAQDTARRARRLRQRAAVELSGDAR